MQENNLSGYCKAVSTPSFHYRPNGSCPYEEYVQKVFSSGRKKDAAKIRVYVDRLGTEGSQRLMEMLWAEKMNDVWQLRPGHHRIFYFWDSQARTYVLPNGYDETNAAEGVESGRVSTTGTLVTRR